jgi:vacuolar-type H+-ATPase catalytic subunit A/Vma1
MKTIRQEVAYLAIKDRSEEIKRNIIVIQSLSKKDENFDNLFDSQKSISSIDFELDLIKPLLEYYEGIVELNY